MSSSNVIAAVGGPLRRIAHRHLHSPGFLVRFYSSRKTSDKESKPFILEEPSHFRPPSHPARLVKQKNNNATPRQYPGPRLSETELKEQQTKKYPHMMPPNGSLTYWILTNKSLHMWFTLSVLTVMAITTFFVNFAYETPFADLLPPVSDFRLHPLEFLSQYWNVYRMHTSAISKETAARRKRKIEDVEKRSEYREAHGLNEKEGIRGWTVKSERERLGPRMVDIEDRQSVVDAEQSRNAKMDEKAPDPNGNENSQTKAEQNKDVYVDFEGNKKNSKKWFGIW